MAKSSRTDTAIEKVNPSFLAQYEAEDKSLAGTEEYRVIPRIKIIQGMTNKDLRDKFGEGVAIVRPGDLVLCTPQKTGEQAIPENSFLFVPLLFFPEFCKWSDPRDKDGPMIRARSFDRASDLRRRADDPEKRFELYPGEDAKKDKPRRFRFVHHLRFPGVVYGNHPLAGTAIVLSFERGEYNNGVNFISSARMRRQKILVDNEERMVKVPLWAQVWKFTPGWRPRSEGGGWWGFNYLPPDEKVDGFGSLITESEAGEFNKLHMELSELYDQQRLHVEEVDSVEEEADPGEVPAGVAF